jgi:hypothetical protein
MAVDEAGEKIKTRIFIFVWVDRPFSRWKERAGRGQARKPNDIIICRSKKTTFPLQSWMSQVIR